MTTWFRRASGGLVGLKALVDIQIDDGHPLVARLVEACQRLARHFNPVAVRAAGWA
ncbi:hypothetical protein [Amycolatopsis cihanbeyliensis]|uniref:hypothetical protein n=1 Tax=Amycolatopsis cihanbeyliensis TaxID=1128664 RepID=UPI001B87A920|nr:hypothetical protein [Amycolatopsis cihanbeyliensis]